MDVSAFPRLRIDMHKKETICLTCTCGSDHTNHGDTEAGKRRVRLVILTTGLVRRHHPGSLRERAECQVRTVAFDNERYYKEL